MAPDKSFVLGDPVFALSSLNWREEIQTQGCPTATSMKRFYYSTLLCAQVRKNVLSLWRRQEKATKEVAWGLKDAQGFQREMRSRKAKIITCKRPSTGGAPDMAKV